MKRFLFVVMSVLYLCTVAFALPDDFDVYNTDDLLAEEPEIVVDDILEDEPLDDDIEYLPFYVSDPELDGAITDVQVMSLNPVTPSDTSGLKAVLLELIGDYDAVVVEYQYQNNNMTGYNYLREVQPDYVWLCSCGLFAIVIYCLFRLGGALLRD